ncbi:RNA_polymerase Rpb4 domain-containing protein [Hexamita inflata]|uniref:RNA polymerase Rpb4 domain-containing protein n=1 Tax=Hexamita inflata TaxID=28002 RepID=A0AA86RHK8_9EUKA|nr:RNA polymerase Rpb4 domain-containing protein [Hexamita inflata]
MKSISQPKFIMNRDVLKLLVEKNKQFSEQQIKQAPEELKFDARLHSYLKQHLKNGYKESQKEQLKQLNCLTEIEILHVVNLQPQNECELFILLTNYQSLDDNQIQAILSIIQE